MTDLATKLVNALIETIEHDQGIIPARTIDRAKEVIAAGEAAVVDAMQREINRKIDQQPDVLRQISEAIGSIHIACRHASEHLEVREITITTARADGFNRLARALAASPSAPRMLMPEIPTPNQVKVHGVNLRVIPAPGSAGSPFPPKPEPPTTEQQARIDAMKERLLAEWIEKVAPVARKAADDTSIYGSGALSIDQDGNVKHIPIKEMQALGKKEKQGG